MLTTGLFSRKSLLLNETEKFILSVLIILRKVLIVTKALGSQRCQCWLVGRTENVENCGEKNYIGTALYLFCPSLLRQGV